MCWFWIRVYYLPVPALMLEPVGIFGAIGRGYRLTRTAVLADLRHRAADRAWSRHRGQMLAFPIALIGQVARVAVVAPSTRSLVLVVTQALARSSRPAFVAPFTSAVTSLQYLDQRMRKEAYDVELMKQAGITAS